MVSGAVGLTELIGGDDGATACKGDGGVVRDEGTAATECGGHSYAVETLDLPGGVDRRCGICWVNTSTCIHSLGHCKFLQNHGDRFRCLDIL